MVILRTGDALWNRKEEEEEEEEIGEEESETVVIPRRFSTCLFECESYTQTALVERRIGASAHKTWLEAYIRQTMLPDNRC